MQGDAMNTKPSDRRAAVHDSARRRAIELRNEALDRFFAAAMQVLRSALARRRAAAALRRMEA
jgi:hypothetical protein